MKTLSLELRDDIFNNSDNITLEQNKTRNSYVNETITYYNKINKRKK